jgi:hypothetical protein
VFASHGAKQAWCKSKSPKKQAVSQTDFHLSYFTIIRLNDREQAATQHFFKAAKKPMFYGLFYVSAPRKWTWQANEAGL